MILAVRPRGAGRIAFLDVEASGLGPDSFPIEIGWAILGGSAGSMLIKPAPDWSQDAWDGAAEDLHGIHWSDLQRHGQPIDTAAEQLCRVLTGGMLVLTDAMDWDRFWIERLFYVTTAVRRFELAYFWRALAMASDRQTVLRLRRAADTANRRHRAQADAELLRDIWIVATTPQH